MKAGDTFVLEGKSADRHIRVIFSNPDAFPDAVIFVTMTSVDVTKEKVCVIKAGEHSNVHHLTCIAYERIMSAKREELVHLFDTGELHSREPVSEEILARIRTGASLSRDIKPELLDVLLEQGVLD
jgi:hypothetical protein